MIWKIKLEINCIPELNNLSKVSFIIGIVLFNNSVFSTSDFILIAPRPSILQIKISLKSIRLHANN